MALPKSKLMSNAWTGGQYSVVRAIFGAYLLARFLGLISCSVEIAGSTAIMLIGAAASLAVLMGLRDRIAAYVLAVVWTAGFVRPPLIDDSSSILIVVLLLLHAATSPRPFGSWDARGRVDPDSGWRMSPTIYTATWLLMIVAIAQAALGELAPTAWLPASVLGASLVLAALTTRQALRRWLWSGLLCTQIGVGLLGSEPSPNAGLILMQLFTLDPGWLRARLPERQTDQEHTIVYYDGSCGLCHRTIRFLLAEDAAGLRFRYAPLDSDSFCSAQSDAGNGFPENEAVPDSVVVYRPNCAMLTRAAGALEIGHQLGGLWRALAVLGGWVPIGVLNGGYDFIARVRHRLFKRPTESCPLIPAELRGRFLR